MSSMRHRSRHLRRRGRDAIGRRLESVCLIPTDGRGTESVSRRVAEEARVRAQDSKSASMNCLATL